tara:strand:- start:422 stop:1024 length:603 start_codon:yes stop_codon:yes gene_type:complete
MSDSEISKSDIYLKDEVVFEREKSYLIKANSGKGKSSLLNFLYGNNTNFDGNIQYDLASEKNFFNFRQSKISYVFQDLKLFPDLTLFENIQLKNSLTNFKTKKEIEILINRVSLDHKKNTQVSKLSWGQKQRVAIIRALCQPFEFILLDEPFSHLDNHNIKIIADILKKEIEKQKAGLIMTSLGSLDEMNVISFDKVLNI